MATKEKGFSLVEIIIVLAIIGFLATVSIISFKPQEIFSNSRNAKRIGDIQSINSAISHYLSREGANNTNPYLSLGLIGDPSINPVTPKDGNIEDEGIPTSSLNVISIQAYLTKTPKDPNAIDEYRVGVDNMDKPLHILVCTNKIELSDTYPGTMYPNGIYCLSN
jgi:prepilin-type N-terminal cleavage/methylation domain-containing protein